MSDPPVIETARLVLRGFRDADRAPFAAMNADPEVMRHFPAMLSAAESDALVERIRAKWRDQGLGLFAVEVKGQGFIGIAGLNAPVFEAHFTPCVEIGWRLARAAWGQGYAAEAARASLVYGFRDRGLAEVVSFTVPANTRSRALMERLGMTRDPEGDFDHPVIAEGHPLCRHLLYRLACAQWRATPHGVDGPL